MRTLLLLPLLFVATPVFAAEIKCEGPYGADSSEARLIETFGAENVVTGDVPGPEGTTLLATTIFPNDEATRQEFGWWNEEAREQLAYVTVPEGATTPGGLALGMTVKEVEALNGGPFELYGFFWDYGGTAVTSGGKFENLRGGCTVSFRFGVGDYAADLNVDAISGDTLISSSEPLLEKVDARIQSLTIGYPDPNATED